MQNIEKEISGELFEKMILSGAANLHEHLETVNDLNVFPIPDGDTGDNMFLTFKGGLDAINNDTDNILSQKADVAAKGMLLGARGNSGVILSQLFYGLSVGLTGKASATVKQFAEAMLEGVKSAYSAVAQPVEGTILTVAREAAQSAFDKTEDGTTVAEYFNWYLSEMKSSLERTPELLATLKEAGVIDSGGAGLVYIAEGFCRAINGDEVESSELAATVGGQTAELDFTKFTENDVMKYGYCTEMLLRLQTSKCDVDSFSVEELIAFLDTLGDSIVAFKTGTIVKIHVHTMTPYRVLEHCQQFGEYLTVKIENMTLQHNEAEKKTEKKVKRKHPHHKYSVVTTAMGEGFAEVFRELGADEIVYGGQTSNPSAEDFVEAFEAVNADYIYVLPNNGNIVMAAKQAAELFDKATVYVVETKNIGQGYSILSSLDLDSDDPEQIYEQMCEDMTGSVTGLVAQSVRCVELNGVDVQKGNYMGFTDKTMLVSDSDMVEVAKQLVDKIVGGREFLIAAYGKSVTDEQKSALEAYVNEKYPRVEYYGMDGQQDVYDFVLILE